MRRKIALGAVAAGTVAACAFLIGVLVREGLADAAGWAGVAGGVAAVVAAGAALLPLVPRPATTLPPGPEVPGWAVGRPAELDAVAGALAGGAVTVGVTTGLYGAGGFGKTTLARMACADRRVRRRFKGSVYWVTVGQDTRGPAAVAAKVNEVIRLVFGEDAAFTDPELAGARLGSLLAAGPRRLLVLDDVWETGQLVPFTTGGRNCALLVTTRVPELLAGRGTAVRVDQMTDGQARQVLTAGLPPLGDLVTAGLVDVTGRWPLLLRLVNKVLADYTQAAGAAAVPAQAAALWRQLAADGPAVMDDIRPDGGRGIDVGRPEERAKAVRATIGASTGLLDGDDAERFAELGVFAEDEVIPFHLAGALWNATAGLGELRAAQLCARLAQLALVSQHPGPDGGIMLHDVIRDFLRAGLGEQQLAALNSTLVEVAADGLPAAGAGKLAAAWWELGLQDRYLWDHLIEHLRDAGRPAEAETVACDLRWAGARLERFGPAAPAADLAAAGTPRATRLRQVMERTAHLLAPTDPPGAVTDILHCRVAADPDWGPQVAALAGTRPRPRPRLASLWPLPDLATTALRRVLAGHADGVAAVAAAPDGTWLATASWDGTARIWDTGTGRELAVLKGHAGRVTAVAAAPDGSWLATAGSDGTARIWDIATGRERAILHGHTSPVTRVAAAPDGSWLATAGLDGTVRIWDTATGRERATPQGHEGTVEAVATAPDGSWLATASSDGTARIWDTATGRERATLRGHASSLTAVAAAPDGSWLATTGSDGTARIWDIATGRERATLKGHTGWVAAVAAAPDGSWLATAGSDGTARIWDIATGRERATLQGHASEVTAVAAAPDGSWLATAGSDGTARIWDIATGRERATLQGHASPLTAVAAAPDGSWLATASRDRTARIWDTATGREHAVLKGHAGEVTAVAAAPDGSWLATAGYSRTVRIWDTGTGRERAVLKGHAGWVRAVAAAPDGSWLATADNGGTVRIWDTATGRERATMHGHAGEVRAVAAAPDGSWLATAGYSRTVRIWDTGTGRERAVLKGHDDSVEAVAAAPDGSWLATASRDGTARIWEIATGRERAVLKGHDDAVRAVAAAPDGSWLATGGSDGTVRIWDTATGRERAVLKGHAGWVMTMAAAPDGSWLATADNGGTARIWDTATGRERANLQGHTGEVTAVAAAPDGSWLATAGRDGTARIWDTATGDPKALMRVEGPLSACTWPGPDTLAVGGSAGLYVFHFLVV